MGIAPIIAGDVDLLADKYLGTAYDRVMALANRIGAIDSINGNMDALLSAAAATGANVQDTLTQVGIATTQAGIATAANLAIEDRMLILATNLILTQTILVQHHSFN